MKLLITGAAGFIGYHLTKHLAGDCHEIICIDNINDYYDVDLKYARLPRLVLPVTKLKLSREMILHLLQFTHQFVLQKLIYAIWNTF